MTGGKRMKYRKIIASLLLIVLAIVSLVGCGNNEATGNYDSEGKTNSVSSKIVASNQDYELKWDDAAKCVLMVSKKTGEIWSDILYDAYLEGSSSTNAKSAINITVVNETNLSWETYSSAAELGVNAKMTCEEIENGVCVTYYFERLEIAVPITYQLREDSLAISIDGSKIQEGDTVYKIVSVNVAPYLCSAVNSKDNYLFIPSGSGALMYTAQNADGTRKFSGEVYGTDAARRILKSTTNDEQIYMPVFGAKDTTSAVLGIIEEGAESSFIDAQAGYARLGYSQVGVNFYFRGYDTFRHGTYATGNAVITRTSQERLMKTVTVAYYPLEGENADYNGMAKCYREYLLKNEELKTSNIGTSPYSISLLGGTSVARSFVGVPYDTVESLTTFKEAKEILEELTQQNGIAPITRMLNYGDNGLLPGSIAGGKTYENVFGSKKEVQTLQEYCEDTNIPLFWDFDIVRYSKSGNGFSYNKDSAKTAIHYLATQYPVTPIRLFDEEKPYRIIGRENLSQAMEKALDKGEKYGHTALSFSSLGELAFSDYDDSAYVMKADIEQDATELLLKAAEKTRVAVAGANSYAAGVADVVFDVSLGYGGYNMLDEQIPFYQMVFHSYKPMYTTAINRSENAMKDIMLAAVSGTGLGFTLNAEYISDSSDYSYDKLYAGLYESNKEFIRQTLQDNQFIECYEKTVDSAITKYEILGNGLSATHFENGTVIYANHTSEEVDSPIGTLGAYVFKVQ